MRQFIIDIIEDPWMAIESLLAAVFAFGGLYLFILLAAAFI